MKTQVNEYPTTRRLQPDLAQDHRENHTLGDNCLLTSDKIRRSGRILVVDDAKHIREILYQMLSHMGFEVATAGDGYEGLKMFRQGSYGLVLTDLKMPGMDGWYLASRIKDESPYTRVVLITGEEEEAVMKRLKASDVDSALFKPFKLEELTAAVERLLALPNAKLTRPKRLEE